MYSDGVGSILMCLIMKGFTEEMSSNSFIDLDFFLKDFPNTKFSFKKPRVLGHGFFDRSFIYLVLILVYCFVVLLSVLFRLQLICATELSEAQPLSSCSSRTFLYFCVIVHLRMRKVSNCKVWLCGLKPFFCEGAL